MKNRTGHESLKLLFFKEIPDGPESGHDAAAFTLCGLLRWDPFLRGYQRSGHAANERAGYGSGPGGTERTPLHYYWNTGMDDWKPQSHVHSWMAKQDSKTLKQDRQGPAWESKSTIPAGFSLSQLLRPACTGGPQRDGGIGKRCAARLHLAIEVHGSRRESRCKQPSRKDHRGEWSFVGSGHKRSLPPSEITGHVNRGSWYREVAAAYFSLAAHNRSLRIMAEKCRRILLT
jgi:hypothetical protein